jgi:hypothetical protein
MKSQLTSLSASTAFSSLVIHAAVLIFLTPLARASAQVESFRNHAAALPTSMIESGYERIGDVNARELLSRLDQLDVQFVSQIKRSGQRFDPDLLRDSARWERQQNRMAISLDERLWARTKPNVKPVLAFHELLGVLGYTDRIYACSGAIWVLTQPEARAELDRAELSRFEQLANQSCRSSGGSTGVTGGGDEFGVAVKISGLENGLRTLRTSSDPSQRSQIIDQMQGRLVGSEVNLVRGGRFTKPMPSTTSLPHVFKRRPIVSSITVEQDGVLIPQDAKNGWTFDPSTNAIWFHGRSAKQKYMSRHVGADLED